jgi:hypothetical protein
MSLNVGIRAICRYLAHLSACAFGFINWIQTNGMDRSTLEPGMIVNWYTSKGWAEVGEDLVPSAGSAHLAHLGRYQHIKPTRCISAIAACLGVTLSGVPGETGHISLVLGHCLDVSRSHSW